MSATKTLSKTKKSTKINADDDRLMRLCVEASQGCRWFELLKSASREIIEMGLRPDGSSSVVDMTFPSEEFKRLHVMMGVETSRRFPMPPSKELLVFLDENEALDLVSVTSPSPYISAKAPNNLIEDLKHKSSQIFLPFFTPNMRGRIDPIPKSTLIMCVSAYKKACILLNETQSVLDDLKTRIMKEKPFVDQGKGEKISYICNKWTIFSATNPGGMRFINRASFVAKFGESVAEMFDVVYEKPMFRIETEEEKDRRMNLLMDFSNGEKGSRRGFYRSDFVSLNHENIEDSMDVMMQSIREEVESR